MRIAATILAVITLLGAGSTASASLLANGDFEGPEWTESGIYDIDTQTYKNTVGWISSAPSNRVDLNPSGGNPGACAEFFNAYSPRRIIQFVADGGSSTGNWTLHFDLRVDSVKDGTYWGVDVFGVPAETTGNFRIETMGNVPAGVTSLLSVEEPCAEPFGWTSLSYEVPLGGGHDYLAVRLTGAKPSNNSMPGIGFDNVSLVPEPLSMALMAVGFSALRRRLHGPVSREE